MSSFPLFVDPVTYVIPFDGQRSVQVPRTLLYGASFTIEMWILVSEIRTYQRLWDSTNGPGGVDQVILYLDGQSMPVFQSGYTAFTSTTAIPLNKWTHLSFSIGSGASYTGPSPNSTILVKIDGVEGNSGSVPNVPFINRTTTYLGRSSFASDPIFKGAMTDIRLWTYNRYTSLSSLDRFAEMPGSVRNTLTFYLPSWFLGYLSSVGGPFTDVGMGSVAVAPDASSLFPVDLLTNEATDQYMRTNPDVAASSYGAYPHYIYSGAKEGRVWPGPGTVALASPGTLVVNDVWSTSGTLLWCGDSRRVYIVINDDTGALYAGPTPGSNAVLNTSTITGMTVSKTVSVSLQWAPRTSWIGITGWLTSASIRETPVDPQLSVSILGSSTMAAAWNNIEVGAVYTVVFTSKSGAPSVTAPSISTSSKVGAALSVVTSALMPGTVYDVSLSVIPSHLPALIGSEPVYNLGSYGIPPWGNNLVFPDSNAQFIWNLASAASSAPMTTVRFSTQYNSTNALAIQGVLHCIVDNYAEIRLNGVRIAQVAGGWTDSNYAKIAVTFAPGRSVIDVIAYNSAVGPAGLLMTLLSPSGSVMLNTNKDSWVSMGTVAPLLWASRPLPSIRGRYIKIQGSVVQCMNWSQCEVSSFQGGPNICVGTTVTASSVYQAQYAPGNLVDGNKATSAGTSCADIPWFTIDLGSTKTISTITLTNRQDCCQQRAVGCYIMVLDETGSTPVFISSQIPDSKGNVIFSDTASAKLSYMRYDILPPNVTPILSLPVM